MDINYIPTGYTADLDLQHLRVLDVLLRERSLTRAAKVLDVTQPALSKTLARLRRFFDDPLFVRVSHRMEPTPKALALAKPVADLLEQMRALRGDHVMFDPKRSNRTFQFCVVDAGVIKHIWKAAGRYEVIAVFEFENGDQMDAAIHSLPIWTQGFAHVVEDIEWIPLRPYRNWNKQLEDLAKG